MRAGKIQRRPVGIIWMRLWLRLCDALKINFKTHNTLVWWLGIFIVAGIVVGIITVAAGEITAREINMQLVDRNIINAAAANATIGQFISGRVLSIFMPLLLLFGLGLIARWLTWIVFPLMGLQGYWLVMSIWWTLNFYTMGAVFLAIFYAIWLLVVMLILVAGAIWVMKLTENIRCCGFRAGCRPRELLCGLGALLAAAVFLATLEFLIYWVVLGRIVYRNAWDLPPNLR